MSDHGSIEVIGYIWWPNDVPCAYSYPLDGYAIDNMRADDGKIARTDIQGWIDTHCGDFSEVTDFRATVNNAEYGWKSEESEWTYADCMYGDDS